MKYSLRTKLSVSYVLVILICVSMIIIVSNLVLERQFRTYVSSQQQQDALDMVDALAESYAAQGQWDETAIAVIGADALDGGMIISVETTDGAVIWDANTSYSGMCQQMLTNMSSNMESMYSNWQGEYEETEYEISVDGEIVGIVNIGSYGPFYYTDSDLDFIKSMNLLILLAGAFSAVLALFVGILLSRQISNPIARVIDKAQRIAQGLYGETIIDKSKTKEIRRLVNTINTLADTLQLQEEKSLKAANDIAHELRTPLTTIQGNLEAVMDGVMELSKERVAVLYDEILRLNRLVGDLAELARYERKEALPQKTTFDVLTLIQETVFSAKDDFEKEDKKLHFEGASQFLSADRDEIRQVLVNLLSNALKYTRSGDETAVELTGDADSVQIVVRDTGIGIAETDLPFIFERFYRTDKSRNSQSGGSGIGLTIVKSIITAHGGTIDVKSRVGSGTEFSITLPRQ